MAAVANIIPTGDVNADGILSGIKWGVNALTFSFPTDPTYYGPAYGSGETNSGFKAFTAIQQAAVRSILAEYASVMNFTFTEVTESATTHGDLRYAESSLPSTAWAYMPSSAALGGDAWFGATNHWYDSPVIGNYAWDTLMHETGHALGLKHPQDAVGAFGTMPSNHDSVEYTVMAYRSYIGAALTGLVNETFGYPQTLMMYDVLALQDMYGAKYTTNSGDTIYKWNPLTGQEFVNGIGQAPPGANRIFMNIWDGGGRDTYDFSNYTTNLKVDLTPGGWTTVATAELAYLGGGHYAAGNISNSLLYQGNTASLIEDAVGGSGNDIITGNVADNHFTGNAGNDALNGGAGNDTAVYSGLQSNYQMVHNADGSWTITDLRAGSPDGTDTLTNIEFAQFSNSLVSLNTLQTITTLQTPIIMAFSSDSGMIGDRITNDNTLTFSGSATTGSTVKVLDGLTLLGTAIAAVSGAWTFTTAMLNDGSHSFAAIATGSAGTTSAASTPLVVTIDTLAPGAPIINTYSTDTGIVGDGITSDNTLSLSGVAAAGSAVSIYDGVTLIATTAANVSGAWTFVTAPLADGSHAFTAKATDAAGNKGVASSAFFVKIDTLAPIAPSITSFSPDTGAIGDHITTANILAFAGTGEINSAIMVYDGATALGQATVNATGNWSFTTASLIGGTHAFTAKDIDAAGNVSAASAALSVAITSTGTVNHAPVVVTQATAMARNQIDPASVLFSAADPDGNAITKYQFWDGTTWATSGHFELNGVAQPAQTILNVSAAQLSQTSFHTGTSTDNIQVRAFDGSIWSDWTSLKVDIPNHAPVVVAHSTVAARLDNVATSTLFSVTDADGDAIAQYQFWDGTASATSGHFELNGVAQPAQTILTVSAAQLSQTSFHTGTSIDNIQVRAFDGSIWSDWTSLKVDIPNQAPIVVAHSAVAAPGASVVTSTLFAVSDPDGDAIAQYQFWDGTATATSGHFTVNGVAQPSQTILTVSPAQMSQIGFQAGTTVDYLSVRAFDGSAWSGWTMLPVSVSSTQASVAASNEAAVQVVGMAKNHTLVSTTANEGLTGGAGRDTFVFGTNFGQDIITDFHATGADHDVIEFKAGLFSDLASLIHHTTEVGADMLIATDAHDTVTIHNLTTTVFLQNHNNVHFLG